MHPVCLVIQFLIFFFPPGITLVVLIWHVHIFLGLNMIIASVRNLHSSELLYKFVSISRPC